ncbi:MAG: family transcriptional regulator, cyclic receptor protein [Ilumatobacteraceae bacterium]|nr:family transcriptional regulator, cyclic receptor protein [Ilumatobacteraceae bacterium]
MEWAILSSLSVDERRAVLASTVRRRYRKGEVIFHEDDVGESLHLLERGRAAIRVSNAQGDQVIINVIGPGAFFGEQALVGDNNHRSATLVALQPVETLALHRTDFDRLRAAHPAVDSMLVTALSERVNRLTDHLLEALFTSADKRLCRRLLELTGTYLVPGASGPISIPLTQEELASLAGTSRPTANRVLQDLVQSDIIVVRRGSVDVLDDARLKSRCL